jgi:hypothetical protein
VAKNKLVQSGSQTNTQNTKDSGCINFCISGKWHFHATTHLVSSYLTHLIHGKVRQKE